jgi:hypothetical protein
VFTPCRLPRCVRCPLLSARCCCCWAVTWQQARGSC